MDQEAPSQVMTITDAAANRVRAMIDERGKPTGGVRVGVRTAGCSGLSYTLEFTDEASEFDAVVSHNGVTILVDPKAQPYLQGSEMDFVEKNMESGFVFKNPNEKSRCGCGESFHV
jgi:iron-sulfur cluster assembly protein